MKETGIPLPILVLACHDPAAHHSPGAGTVCTHEVLPGQWNGETMSGQEGLSFTDLVLN